VGAWACKVSSEALGFKHEPLEFSNSRHAVLDLARITWHFKKMGFSSQTSLRPTTPLSFATQARSSVSLSEPSGGKPLVPDTVPSGSVSEQHQSNLVVTTGTDSEHCNAFLHRSSRRNPLVRIKVLDGVMQRMTKSTQM